jgi:branched-chain amino acid transport system permease protein
VQSIDLLLMVVIGGLGSVHGAFLGAIFLITHAAADRPGQGLPARRPSARRRACRPTVYGVVLMAFVLFEPLGLYGRWLKIRTWLQLFPFYRKGMFKRQKSLPEIGAPEMSTPSAFGVLARRSSTSQT